MKTPFHPARCNPSASPPRRGVGHTSRSANAGDLQGARTSLRVSASPRLGVTLSRLSALLLLATLTAWAGTAVPLEFRQQDTTYNLQSQGGVPISATVGVPPGSDGRMPTGLTESGTPNVPTANQFAGVVTFGGIAAPTDASLVALAPHLNGASPFSGTVAAEMQLPRAMSNGVVTIVQRRVQVAAPYQALQVSLVFGSIVEVPKGDERGSLLNVVKETYWLPEPYSTNNHLNTGYYWSPHAQLVFAIQAGVIRVTWRKATPYALGALPTYTNPNGSTSFETNGTSVYLLYTETYAVSGSASKHPRKIYWTEKEYRYLGKPVAIPSARLGGINIVYNNTFPRTVAEEYHGPGYTTPTEGGTNKPLPELRTLWYDQSQGLLYAYNQEGRVFVELLGDAKPDGQSRFHLGFEIVDVLKQPNPADISTELGELLVPPSGGPDELIPEPLLQLSGPEYNYKYIKPVTNHPYLYAQRQTDFLNACLVHWMEAGLEGILWPTELGRYRLYWPTDAAKYSHYVRPLVATEEEAKQTAVQMAADDVPLIAYQDPMDRPRAKLTPDFKFYTFLTTTYPSHRTLLRYSAGENLGFERVFSWLDLGVRQTNLTDQVALTLTEVDAYANYPAHLAAYSNKWAAVRAQYEAQWQVYTNYLANYSNYVAQWVGYTNYLAAVSNYYSSPAYIAYTNWVAQSAAYSNYLALTTFQTDFSGPNNLAAVFGHASITGGSLRLTEASGGQTGSYVLSYLTNYAVSNFVASFTVCVKNPGASWGGTAGADGFSFVFGTVADTTFSTPQEGIASGLSVTYDTWENGPNDLGIDIKRNGTRVGYYAMTAASMITGDTFVPMRVVLRDNGSVDVYWNGVKVLDNIATGYVPRTGRFGLAATTGGAWETHWIDDLSIAVNAGYGPPDPGAAPPDPGPPPAVVNAPGAPPLPVPIPTEPVIPPAPVLNPKVWADVYVSPRILHQTVEVGQRLAPPEGELGSVGSYLAGYINQSQGTLFDPEAYVDPFASGGLAAANLGAIIPINAIPGANVLEVLWFRANSNRAGLNAGNGQLGFATVYWPSLIGRYTIVWPANPREIVLASKLGSGTLDTLEALGKTYRQNNRALPGYNPNEEHALMAGGTAFATRDDLNITTGPNYSSEPYVLVQYRAADGRPAISPFKVLREKPEAGYVFDYISPAGQILQPPMPLPLLAKPVLGTGDDAVNYNTEPVGQVGDLPGGWNNTFATSGSYTHYNRFTWRDRHHDFWVYRGLHAGIPKLLAGSYNDTTGVFGPLPNATAVVGSPFQFTLHASRQDEHLTILTPGNMPPWAYVRGLSLLGTPGTNDVGTTTLELVVEDLYDHNRVTNSLTLAVVAAGSVQTQPPLALVCSNGYSGTVVIFTTRPPFLAANPVGSNSFVMRYYYKTDASFDWVGLANPPPAGTIVPYLRPWNSQAGEFVGDPASKDTESLAIVYRPVWPVRDPKDSSKPLPTLPFGATLTVPKWNLPGVRDMLTAEFLYQQSIASNLNTATRSAVLHDATRAKYADLKARGLDQLPGGVANENYRGMYYFPNLVPHLASRVFYDPNRGANGSLVLEGGFVEEVLGESYLLLNVLRDSDLDAVKALCPAGDNDKSKWDALVNALATSVETFYENPQVPGTYIPNPSLTYSVAVGDLAAVGSANTAVDSYAVSATGPSGGYVTLVESSGTAFTQPGDPVSMHIFKVGGANLYVGEVKVIPAANPLSELITFQHTADLAGRFSEFEYEWKIAQPVDGLPPVADVDMTRYQALASGLDLPRRVIGGAGIQALCDNYVVMRYRAKTATHPLYNQWSEWTAPKLGEGWIKRVLAGINPFNQRVTDLFNNRVNTQASMLTQAGKRWEGDVALNLESINKYGLIEIYETVLRRGRMLSIESGYNYGPANDALLLAAGYLNDLYMMIGGEAWADAANPTIGIGTKDRTYGDIATALFAFKGQVASLLDEELALLRGRDDFLLPGVQVSPIYNRLVWNYTRGIDAGEVIYALNYNVQENPDHQADGVVNAEDAAHMFPQGHGDAYGHYLTALKGYYSLLMNSYFDWVPRIEAVNVLGQPVSVDYMDERKFAAAAAALARAGAQVFDLTWRKDYQPIGTVGWAHLGASRANAQRKYAVPGQTNSVTRHWGLDHWATRTVQGAYINWLVGNAILPDVDPDALHEGIQKIDRTTVPELREIAATADSVQTALDNAEGGLSPLGIPEGGLALDINPNAVVGAGNGTHFEQIYQRAKTALNNAVASFDDAKDVTRLMRSEQDSLAEYQAGVDKQELAYKNSLIELYGSPYPEDMGPGKTWPQGYDGPDLLHFMYVDLPEANLDGLLRTGDAVTVTIEYPEIPSGWYVDVLNNVNYPRNNDNNWISTDAEWVNAMKDNSNWELKPKWFGWNAGTGVYFNVGPHGFFDKPSNWGGRRATPGRVQQAISQLILAHNQLRQSITGAEGALDDFNNAVRLFISSDWTELKKDGIDISTMVVDEVLQWASYANDIVDKIKEMTEKDIFGVSETAFKALPKSLIAGLAVGGDLTSAGGAAVEAVKTTLTIALDKVDFARWLVFKTFSTATETRNRWTEYRKTKYDWEVSRQEQLFELGNQVNALADNFTMIAEKARLRDDAYRKYRSLLAEGLRTQEERLVFRQRAAAVIQGFRTRDAAFRLFRNEKLERYKTLFDLAARYSLLGANAYDYETGLLGTSAGRDFKSRIINARALGVVRNGEPQYAGSNTGDPGLSSALAEMKADWDVLRGRLGFNNPDAYGTTVSLRTECLRILPTSDSDANWRDMLQAARHRNLLDDADVRRYCMQIDDGSGLPVPGIVLTFSTTVANGLNLFGRELAAGDNAFSPSSFATKIFGVGVALEGYRGMSNPAANSGGVSGAGATSPADPSSWYLDPLGLASTPYVYLIPVGVDSMRTPPLGDASNIRTWSVDDLAIPMPFNIGASELSTRALWQSGDSLTEPLFAIRKHQAFRPVSTTAAFSSNLYGTSGTLQRSPFTNNRLVGRSVWNSLWKLVIPGRTLLNDPNQGLDRFIQTVTDVKLHLVTYSYSGN